MKIALITLHTPTSTNMGGASALPYHLMLFRPKGVDVSVYSFNINNIESAKAQHFAQELGVSLHLMELDKGQMRKRLRWRAVLPLPPLAYLDIDEKWLKTIAEEQCDSIWIYGEELSHMGKRFAGKKVVVTGPDCEAMYYHRLMKLEHSLLKRLRYRIAGHKYDNVARRHPQNAIYHLVGKEDAEFLKNLNLKLDARFIRHPHYDIGESKRTLFSDAKIRLLIAGRNDIYMGAMTTAACEAIAGEPDLAQHYEITFLGKGWDVVAARLKAEGFDAKVKTWVDDYATEVLRHDIQLTPIAVGTGTKGKVLDAFANGLLVIGTERALENIAVEDGVSCVNYSNESKLIAVLKEIPSQREKYAEMAACGRSQVLNEHSREKIAEQFFELF